jgi:hypothetical protein
MSLINLNEKDVERWTLRLVVERGELAFECRNCWHLSQVDALALVGRFGPEIQVGKVRVRMVCRQCGSRQVRSLVRLKVGRGDRAWAPTPPTAGR